MSEKGKQKAEQGTIPVSSGPAGQEAVYTVGEFAANAKRIFGGKAGPDAVYAAFQVNGMESATVSKAREAVDGFLAKEVM